MQTPWGKLEDLDLTDTALAEQILSADKHQLLEGLVVESLFDQFIESIPANNPGVLPLDVETIIARPGPAQERWIAVVWARNKTEGLGRYLAALENRFRVFLVEFVSGTGFCGAEVTDGKRLSAAVPLDDLLRPVAAKPHEAFRVDKAVRDAMRQKTATWGFLINHYGQTLAAQVLLPRILINCGVQPWFRGVWNLDRIFMVDGKPWLFEVKHKFPFGKKTLKFGLNNGEANVISLLSGCGIDTLHSIMVKPKWSKEVGSHYMLSDLAARDRAAIVGMVMDAVQIARILARNSGTSGADTTITGDPGGKLDYKPLFVTEFGMIGVFSDKPATIATQLVAEMRGKPAPRATEAELQALRMPL